MVSPVFLSTWHLENKPGFAQRYQQAWIHDGNQITSTWKGVYVMQSRDCRTIDLYPTGQNSRDYKVH